MTETTLADYGQHPDPPKINCKLWVPHPVNDGQRVGTLGTEVRREDSCALFLHRRHDHAGDDGEVRKKTYNTEFGGYAISEWVLHLLEDLSTRTLFVAVTDENVCYEFDLEQYDDGIGFEWRDDDPQRVVATENARYEYDGDAVQMTDPGTAARLELADKHLSGEGMT